MKTTIIKMAVFAFITISVTSCKKTYECHCTKKIGGDEHIEVTAKKSDADNACHELAEGSAVYSECHL